MQHPERVENIASCLATLICGVIAVVINIAIVVGIVLLCYYAWLKCFGEKAEAQPQMAVPVKVVEGNR